MVVQCLRPTPTVQPKSGPGSDGGSPTRECLYPVLQRWKKCSNLVSGLTHELFRRFFPDGWNCNDPADVLVDDPRTGLVIQLLQCVVAEEAERMREDGQRLDRLTVAGRQLRVLVEVLQTRRTN